MTLPESAIITETDQIHSTPLAVAMAGTSTQSHSGFPDRETLESNSLWAVFPSVGALRKDATISFGDEHEFRDLFEKSIQDSWNRTCAGTTIRFKFSVRLDLSVSNTLWEWLHKENLPADTLSGNIFIGSERHSDESGAEPSVRTKASEDTASKIYKLKRYSGLTWDQLASMLNVDRRTLHYWANGRSMKPGMQEKVARLLATIEYIDRGSAAENRDLLMQSTNDGNLLLDLLHEERFDEARAQAGQGRGRQENALKPLDESARRRLYPEPLAERLARISTADEEDVVEDNRDIRHGKASPSKTKRIKRSKSD